MRWSSRGSGGNAAAAGSKDDSLPAGSTPVSLVLCLLLLLVSDYIFCLCVRDSGDCMHIRGDLSTEEEEEEKGLLQAGAPGRGVQFWLSRG